MVLHEALADFISEDFVELMNKKVKEIGLTTMRFFILHMVFQHLIQENQWMLEVH